MVDALVQHRVQLSPAFLEELCRRHRVRRLMLYGSVLRPDYRADSDVDVLVEFETGAPAGLFRLGALADELEREIGRQVDLKTPGFFPESLVPDVIAVSEVLYASADRVFAAGLGVASA